MKKSRVLWIIILLAGLYLFCSATRDFWYPDEPDMAEITWRMVESGDMLRLQLYGREFPDYPPLFFWLSSLAVRIGGFSELVMRLPTILSAIALLSITAIWIRKRIGESAAFWSILTLGTAYNFVSEATHMHLDMVFAFFITASIIAYDLARDAQRRRWLLYAACALSMGIASLVKGPAGIVLPAMVLTLEHLLHKEWRGIVRVGLLSMGGSSLFFVWAFFYWKASGASNLVYFIFQQNISRFLEGHSHRRPIYYYLLNVWPLLLPWSPLLILGLMAGWKALRERIDRPLGLAMIWFLAIFLFFTISKSKRDVYLLPLYPVIGVLMGQGILRLLDIAPAKDAAFRIGAKIIAGILITIGVSALAAAGLMLFRPELLKTVGEVARFIAPTLVIGALMIVAGVLVPRYLLQHRTASGAITLTLATVLAYAVMLGWIMPLLDDPLSAKKDALWLASSIHTSEGDDLAVINNKISPPKESSSLCFYGRLNIDVIVSAKDLAVHLSKQPNDPILVEEDKETLVYNMPGFAPESIRRLQVGSDTFLAVYMHPSTTAANRSQL